MTRTFVIALIGALAAGQAVAAEAETRTGACEKAPATEATTPPAQGPASGTAPGNAGSSGWTGGIGGSNIDTSQSGPQRGSPTDHPATASGLDPTKPEASSQPKC